MLGTVFWCQELHVVSKNCYDFVKRALAEGFVEGTLPFCIVFFWLLFGNCKSLVEKRDDQV